MGKDFETLIIINDTGERAALFLDQFVKMSMTLNLFITPGFDSPTSINPVQRNYPLSEGYIINTRDTANSWVADQLADTLFAIKVSSRAENVRSVLRMCWKNPLVLIEEESSNDPSIIWLGNSVFESYIPDDWAGFFDVDEWASKHLPVITASFELNPYSDKFHPIAANSLHKWVVV